MAKSSFARRVGVVAAAGIVLVAGYFAPFAPAAPGAFELPAERSAAWDLAGLATIGGVPSASWPICNATPLMPSGTGNDTTAINALIESCPVGTVAQLGAGTFYMGVNQFVLLDKGVVLRGAGAGQTILLNPRNPPATPTNQTSGDAVPIVIVGPGRWVNSDGDMRCQSSPTPYQRDYMQLLSTDGVQGSDSVTVADGSIFHPGMFVLLDQTSGASWQPDVIDPGDQVWASPDYTVTYQVHNPAYWNDDPMEAATPSEANNWAGIGNGSDAACWFSRQDRPQNEIKEIASVNGNTVTFTSPLTMDYKVGQYAELTTYTGGNAQVVQAGVEDLSAVGGGGDGVLFTNTAYCWADNVEITDWWGDGVGFVGAFRTELRDSYIHDAAWPEPGGAGYAIAILQGSSELGIENNISVRANKVIVAQSAGAGSVVGYNYMDDGYIATTSGWIEAGINGSHMVGPSRILFEGNQSFNMESDDTHGNSTDMTFFRNYVTTVRAPFHNMLDGTYIDDANDQPGNNGPKRAVSPGAYSYGMSYVGNVLGDPAVTTAANGYVDEITDWTTGSTGIWMMGWNPGGTYITDPNVAASAIRDGNWDSLLGQQTWLTGAPTTLPDSLYLSAKPAFFGADPWPWVDPSTGTTCSLPAKARYDAGTPNSTTPPTVATACPGAVPPPTPTSSTQTATATQTATQTPTASQTQTPTATPTQTATPTETQTPTATQTQTSTATQTATQTPTQTPTGSPSPTQTPTATQTSAAAPIPGSSPGQSGTPSILVDTGGGPLATPPEAGWLLALVAGAVGLVFWWRHRRLGEVTDQPL